jgi:hypothetical protein
VRRRARFTLIALTFTADPAASPRPATVLLDELNPGKTRFQASKRYPLVTYWSLETIKGPAVSS